MESRWYSGLEVLSGLWQTDRQSWGGGLTEVFPNGEKSVGRYQGDMKNPGPFFRKEVQILHEIYCERYPDAKFVQMRMEAGGEVFMKVFE